MPNDFGFEQAIKAGEALGEMRGRMAGFETRMTGLEERIDRQFTVISAKLDILAQTDNEQKGGLKMAQIFWMFGGGIVVCLISVGLNVWLR